MFGKGMFFFLGLCLIPLPFIPLPASAQLPPLPPGFKSPLLSPRALSEQSNMAMSRSLVAAPFPPPTGPAFLVIQGWREFAGERVPNLALRFTTNAPHCTVYTQTGTNWNCHTWFSDIVAGSVRGLGWCPTPNQPYALFKVILHD